MKGPFERLKYDLRRLWECPHCKRRERTDGTITFRFCACPGKGLEGKLTTMTLVEEAGHRVAPEIKYHPRDETSVEDVEPPPEKGLEADRMAEVPSAEVTPPELPLP